MAVDKVVVDKVELDKVELDKVVVHNFDMFVDKVELDKVDKVVVHKWDHIVVDMIDSSFYIREKYPNNDFLKIFT